MERVTKDGLVAVLVSPGFGAGWSTWADEGQHEAALFHPKFVQAALDGVTDIEPVAQEVFGDDHFYIGGWRDICVEWMPVGTQFLVDEYDGSESIRYMDRTQHFTA